MPGFIKSDISVVDGRRIAVRDVDILDLMETECYGDVVFKVFTGRLPEGAEGKLLQSMLIAFADYGTLPSSTLATRVAASCGVPLASALAAGISCLGVHHAPVTKAAILFQECVTNGTAPQAFVETFVRNKLIIPGFGHPISDMDSRLIWLMNRAEKVLKRRKHILFAMEVEAHLNTLKGKLIPLNMAGLSAAILCDMGIDPEYGDSIFILGRSVGLVAHAVEQSKSGIKLITG